MAQVPGMGGGRGPLATARAFEQLTKQARGEIEPVPFETGKFTGLMAVYAQMRVNPTKSIGYSAIEAAEKIKTPMLIIEAGEDELIKAAENGQKVADILKANGTPVEYHLFEGMTHYGIYTENFAEATKLELDWFNKYLKTSGPGPAARKRARR